VKEISGLFYGFLALVKEGITDGTIVNRNGFGFFCVNRNAGKVLCLFFLVLACGKRSYKNDKKEKDSLYFTNHRKPLF